MKIFITEKPSVARQFADAMGIPQTGNTDGYIQDDDIIITWAVGHLVELVLPDGYDEKYKTWNLADLPFLPKEYKYQVIPAMKKQFAIIKKIFTQNTGIIYDCGDSGREGQYIQALIYKQTGSTLPVKRVWIDSQTDEEIMRGIREAKPEEEYSNLADAGYMRAIEDYAFGTNLSRALTKKFEGEMERRTGKRTISVGRVMTCVLGMICERQLQIDNFVASTYYKISARLPEYGTDTSAEWKAVEGSKYYGDNAALYNESGLKEKKEADSFAQDLSQDMQLTVADITYKEEKKYAPLLYNLAELQNDCSKKFKFTPKHTLDIAQSLYEKKLTTYPRTDARVLSSAIAKEITKNIKGLTKGQYRTKEAEDILTFYKGNIDKTRYTNDKKITDHYAIIPTGITNAQLTGEEERVYHLIIDRFLAIFYPPAVFGVYSAVLKHSLNESFFTKSKELKEKGYIVILGREGYEDVKDGSPLARLSKGMIVKSIFEVKEGKTTPPKPYNSGSMILAMENAGNLIEEEELREQIKGQGIGTSATRADIIDKLLKIDYISINKKTQILSPSETGLVVYEIVKRCIPSLLKPKLTANWEMGLSQIERGEISKDQYKKILEDFVTKQVEAIKSMEGEERKEIEPKVIGTCPVCGKKLMQTRLGSYVCEGFKKDGTGCFFSIHSSIVAAAGIDKLSPLLTSGKPTSMIEGIKKKDGSTYNASLSIDLNQKKIVFTFGQSEDNILGKCPKCGGDILKGKFGAYCQNKCGIMGISNYFGKKLTDSQVKRILAGKTVLVKGLHSKAKDVDYNVNIKLKGVVQYTYTSKDGEEKTGYQLDYERSFANDKKALPKSIDAALKEAIQMAKENK